MQFSFGLTEQVFRFGAVTVHVVVIGATRSFHLVDTFHNLPVHGVQIVPVAHWIGVDAAAEKWRSDCQGQEDLFHSYSFHTKFPVLKSVQT
jgi:hypothetical protein